MQILFDTGAFHKISYTGLERNVNEVLGLDAAKNNNQRNHKKNQERESEVQYKLFYIANHSVSSSSEWG